MDCEMGGNFCEEMEIEALPSMWPEDLTKEAGKQFNVEKPGVDQDMLEEVTIVDEPTFLDFKRLFELTSYSERGSSQLAYLVKQWEYKQANAVRLLNEELGILSKQRQEAELKKLEILEEYRFEGDRDAGDKRSVSILDEVYDLWEAVPCTKHDIILQKKKLEVDAEYDTVKYWKKQAIQLEKMVETSIQREQTLQEKLHEVISNLERQSSPVEELSQILKRADNFLHFVLQNAPVVIGHQDKDMRYRFIYNHFPSLQEEDVIGRTDVEIFSGVGVKESQDFKKEVMERGLPAKREITFETELFGSKTFLIHVEPVFSKTGETIGVNYLGMDITDQVKKRERMAQLREQMAVQKAKEKELNRTIHITEETMRAKQMLATMSHEIRSPLTGVVSMAEILANTKLDKEQQQLLDVMLSSGDLVLQLINDILDLSKVESGVMKLEAAKFRPREVVKHVLQTAAASLQKELTLEGHVADEVPIEVIGDVLRIRQILTNLISNAIKFTHEGEVGIKLCVVPEQYGRKGDGEQCAILEKKQTEETSPATSQSSSCLETMHHGEGHDLFATPRDGVGTSSMEEEKEMHHHPQESTVWLRCDVYDTGIGIPENALPTLFKKYMQVSADHARKYGGTGLGLAICKQLVELMGGHLTVTSQEKFGSTFTFTLPCKVSPKKEPSEGSDELSDMFNHDSQSDANSDETITGYFYFKPNKLGSMKRIKDLRSISKLYNPLDKLYGLSQESCLFPSTERAAKDSDSVEQATSVSGSEQTSTEPESSAMKKKDPHTDNQTGQAKQHHVTASGLVMNRYHRPSPDSNTSQFDKDSQHYKKTCVEVPNRTEGNPDGNGTCQSQTHEESDGSLQCTSHSNSKAFESISKAKILLVEDNKINVMVTQSMMKQLGHTIDVVNNGLEAVRAVQSYRYDLILMDVCMPVMDGLKATRLIRSFEENGNWDAAEEAGIQLATPCCLGGMQSMKRIAIIAMTANALAESAAECLANGMDSFVSKPVTFQKLKHCLQQYLPSLNL